ncbi:nucleoid-associated protein [Hazenella coriacea]|uniref:Uncharacterized protein n=1 Tax=Hazenella coriacea TaxID=1179467 RepID=A0A4V2UUU7_9BACL|nr:hypothetical protein [Hazenella coriacea]TCS93247.1 hypothetical protein EDD58_10861 [Hazenella coriacea]
MDSTEIISQLIQRRKDLHPDDPAIQEIWNEMVEVLKDNEEKTISLFNSSSKEELYWLSEIFEDLSFEFQSKKLIDCLLELQEKSPDIDMEDDILYAKESMNNDQ